MAKEYGIEVAARYMGKALEGYVALTEFFLKKGKLEEVCYQSSELLHDLGEDESVSESELEGNSDHMKGLIKGLRSLVLEGDNLPNNKRKIRAQYKEVITHLQEVREMLRSAYKK
jgi:hypothetical protein